MTGKTIVPSRANVLPSTPLRLGVAAVMAFPDGSMTASGLRREHARGRLVVERIAGKLYTTLSEIEKMRALCRENQKVQGSGFESPGMIEASNAKPSGSYSTAHAISPQDALRIMLKAPNNSSPNTSAKSISRRGKSATSKTS